MTDPGSRTARLRALAVQLSAPVSTPDDGAGDQVGHLWMEQQGADRDLSGLLGQAVHGARFDVGDLKSYREASERWGSVLGADSVAEAYRLLAER